MFGGEATPFWLKSICLLDDGLGCISSSELQGPVLPRVQSRESRRHSPGTEADGEDIMGGAHRGSQRGKRDFQDTSQEFTGLGQEAGRP